MSDATKYRSERKEQIIEHFGSLEKAIEYLESEIKKARNLLSDLEYDLDLLTNE
jgi:hypothetical protein